jgi:predicted amidohydrolase YtcJ
VPAADMPHLYPLAALRSAGVVLAAGSDCPVAPPEVLAGVYGAVARRSERGTPVAEGQRLPAEEALRMYTAHAAFAAFEEASHGSLGPGKEADIVLLSGDPTSVPAEEIRGLRVELTMVGGEIAWRTPAWASKGAPN